MRQNKGFNKFTALLMTGILCITSLCIFSLADEPDIANETETVTSVTDDDGNEIGTETIKTTEYEPTESEPVIIDITVSDPIITVIEEKVEEDDNGNPAESKTVKTTEIETVTTIETETTSVKKTEVSGQTEEISTETSKEIDTVKTETVIIPTETKTVSGNFGETVAETYSIDETVINTLLDGEYTADSSYNKSEDSEGNIIYTKEENDTTCSWKSGKIYDENGNLIGYSKTETIITEEIEVKRSITRSISDLVQWRYEPSTENEKIWTYTYTETEEDGTVVTTVTSVDVGTMTQTITTTTTKETTNVKFVTVDEEGKLSVTFGEVAEYGGHGNFNTTGLDVDWHNFTSGTAFKDLGYDVYHTGAHISNNNVGGQTSGFNQYTKAAGSYHGAESAIIPGAFNKEQVEIVILVDNEGKAHYAYCADSSVAYGSSSYYKLTDAEDVSFIKDNAETVKTISENGYWGTSDGTGSMESFKSWLSELGYEGSLESLTPGMAESVTQAAIWHYASSKDRDITDNGDGTYIVNSTGLLGDDISWSYNVNGKYYNEDGIFSSYTIKDGQVVGLYPDLTDEQKAAYQEKFDLCQELYSLIIGKGDNGELNSSKASNLLNKNDVTEASVTVKGSHDKENSQYTADISFDIAVDLGGDNFKKAYSGGPVYVKDASGTWRYGTLTVNDDGTTTATIPDVVLEVGKDLTVQLRGKQTVAKGAYLMEFWNEDTSKSQTLVSIEEGTRDVWMGFNIKINTVEASKVTKNSKTETEITVKVQDVKTWASEETVTTTKKTRNTTTTSDVSTEVSYTYPEKESDPIDEPEDDPAKGLTGTPDGPTNPDTTNDENDTVKPEEEPKTPVKHHNKSDENYQQDIFPTALPYDIELPDEIVPLGYIPDNEPVITETTEQEILTFENETEDQTGIVDSDIPLSDTPKTGDESNMSLWLVLALVSLLGVAGLMLLGKREK